MSTITAEIEAAIAKGRELLHNTGIAILDAAESLGGDQTLIDSLHPWATSDDTGLSSLCLMARVLGLQHFSGDSPGDGSDWARCQRMLALLPPEVASATVKSICDESPEQWGRWRGVLLSTPDTPVITAYRVAAWDICGEDALRMIIVRRGPWYDLSATAWPDSTDEMYRLYDLCAAWWGYSWTESSAYRGKRQQGWIARETERLVSKARTEARKRAAAEREAGQGELL